MSQTDFTIADVLAWARTKPADGWYDYNNPSNCALCQFLKETGRSKRPNVNPSFDGVTASWVNDSANLPYPVEVDEAARAGGYDNRPAWTFGALVARLEKLCPAAPVPPSEWTRLDAYMTDIELASA